MFNYASKIQSLLANAEDEALPEATRAAYRAKAEELMQKYRIEQEELIATDALGVAPIRYEIKMPARSEMSHWHSVIVHMVTRHTGCRYVFTYAGRDTVAVLVGYEGDVRYAEFLWTAALLTFSTRVDPRWDDARTRDENIFLLRNAGIERRRIADMAGMDGRQAKDRSAVQRIYLRECARRGEPARASGLSHQTQTYREAYARSFMDTLAYRLREARDAADAVSGGVVLHGRADRVDEAFYTFFPERRPVVCAACTAAGGLCPDHTIKPCPACAKAETGVCRKHRWTKADQARLNRLTKSASAQAGRASGVAAAKDVMITRGHDRAARLDEGTTRPELDM